MVTRYAPQVEPDPQRWLATDDEVKLQLALSFHRRKRLKLPNLRLHAMVHAVVENQAAMGDETPVAEALLRLVGEGLDRHDAVHAVGSVLMGHLWELLHGGGAAAADAKSAYFEQVRQLTAQKWMEEYTDEEN
ncbi:MAG: hypothetical protein V1772_05485 [Chloroflexota bacterium]